MTRVSASVLSVKPKELRQTALKLEKAGIDEIHFDFMDGEFVPAKTSGHELAAQIKTHIPVSAHLMARRPHELIKPFEDAGATEIIIHYEPFGNLKELQKCLAQIRVKKGISINPGTPVSKIAGLAGKVDSLLIMSVHPGKGGREFIEATLPKIREAKKAGFKNVIVDGGVNDTNAKRIREAGADTLVSGTYLLKDPLKNSEKLRA